VDRVVAARERYVARGVSTPRLVVARASGARIEDVDGRSYLDFAGGIGCQNTGHGFGPVVAAVHEQVDLYLHQCFMVGTYEPYVEVCRRLAELSPCAGRDQKSILVNSGAEAVENAVKIARVATGRPAVVVFDNAFHGRTLLTMTMTSKVRPYKHGFGPFAPEVYRGREMLAAGDLGLHLLQAGGRRAPGDAYADLRHVRDDAADARLEDLDGEIRRGIAGGRPGAPRAIEGAVRRGARAVPAPAPAWRLERDAVVRARRQEGDRRK